jgi:hypothetical protein
MELRTSLSPRDRVSIGVLAKPTASSVDFTVLNPSESPWAEAPCKEPPRRIPRTSALHAVPRLDDLLARRRQGALCPPAWLRRSRRNAGSLRLQAHSRPGGSWRSALRAPSGRQRVWRGPAGDRRPREHRRHPGYLRFVEDRPRGLLRTVDPKFLLSSRKWAVRVTLTGRAGSPRARPRIAAIHRSSRGLNVLSSACDSTITYARSSSTRRSTVRAVGSISQYAATGPPLRTPCSLQRSSCRCIGNA